LAFFGVFGGYPPGTGFFGSPPGMWFFGVPEKWDFSKDRGDGVFGVGGVVLGVPPGYGVFGPPRRQGLLGIPRDVIFRSPKKGWFWRLRNRGCFSDGCGCTPDS